MQGGVEKTACHEEHEPHAHADGDRGESRQHTDGTGDKNEKRNEQEDTEVADSMHDKDPQKEK